MKNAVIIIAYTTLCLFVCCDTHYAHQEGTNYSVKEDIFGITQTFRFDKALPGISEYYTFRSGERLPFSEIIDIEIIGEIVSLCNNDSILVGKILGCTLEEITANRNLEEFIKELERQSSLFWYYIMNCSYSILVEEEYRNNTQLTPSNEWLKFYSLSILQYDYLDYYEDYSEFENNDFFLCLTEKLVANNSALEVLSKKALLNVSTETIESCKQISH